jgi:adenine-specific DNA-methyltransferase
MIYNPQCSMPILNWIGKEAVVNHDKDVSFRLLKKNKSKSVGDSENLIIEGDNLEALKALLPHYQNKIKCIYIDPPYNTGNENWVYNDNVNSPKIKKWLGKVVGKIGEDLSRHDKWLCMMYPRLKLLRELLNESGVIFISIDEIEEHHLRNICDEVFGPENFIEKIVWNKRIPKNDKGIGNIHEYVLVYVKENLIRHKFKLPKEGISEVYNFVDILKKKKIPIMDAEQQLKKFYDKKGYDRGITLYCNLDENYRIWGKINVSWPNAKNGPRYDVLHPKTKKPSRVPDNGWRYKEETFKDYLNYENVIERHDHSFVCGQMWFAKDEKTQPSYIQYLDNVKDFLLRSIVSIKSSGGSELDKILPGHGFSHPKTFQLIKIFLETFKENDFVVLDSFAGSGTTAQSVLELNKEDGGNRKFILVELEPEICKNITAQRVKKVIKGYEDVPGTGGGFQYAVLDKKLFNSDGRINDTCTLDELASYVYFTETKTILDTKKINKTLLGTYNDAEYHLIFKGIGKNSLDRKFLVSLDRQKNKVIYADKCALDDSTLEKYNTVFKQIPYEVKEF